MHCNVAALESRTNSTHPTSGPAGYHPIRKRNSRSMCADFAAHGRPGLSNRECHWIAPVLLAAVQPGPWLRPATSYSPYRTRQTCQRDKVTQAVARYNQIPGGRDQTVHRQLSRQIDSPRVPAGRQRTRAKQPSGRAEKNNASGDQNKAEQCDA